MIITIDGSSGTGKTTVARQVARKLNMAYFDTGAMYRSFCWFLLSEQVSIDDEKQIEEKLSDFIFDVRNQNGECQYFVNEVDVTNQLRTQKINAIISKISAMKKVREVLWDLQKSYAEKQSGVFEGRDMGSFVFPNADLKIFLNAKPKIRAKRRLEEMRRTLPEEASHFDEKKMIEELMRRDSYDAKREIAPLKCPRGAIRINTSKMTIEEVSNEIIRHFRKKASRLFPSWLKSKKMRLFYRFSLCIIWGILKLFYRLKVYGLEHFIRRAAIIAPNHTSFLDPPIVGVSWPEEVHYLAKENLFKYPFFGKLISRLNSHPVRGDVADVSVFKTLITLLKEGKQIVVFPEGGRTNGQLSEIKPGIGMLLMRSQAVIVPTYIHGAHGIWERGRKFPRFFGKITCVFGTPILWESFSQMEKKLAQREIAKRLTESILSLKEWFEKGAEGIPP